MNIIRTDIIVQKPEKKYKFAPQESITAFELAIILPLLIKDFPNSYDEALKGKIITKESHDQLPDNCKLHFTD